MRGGTTAVASFLWLVTLHAFASDAKPFSADAGRYGTAMVIVEPKYPEVAIAAGRGIEFEFSGIVSPLGELTDVRFAPLPPEADVFVTSLREVLPFWRFQTPEDHDCMPAEERVVTRVWFELKEGKPHFSVSHVRATIDSDLREDERVEKRVVPKFPGGPLRAGKEAHVYSRTEIDGEGRVSATHARAYPRDDDASAFERAVTDAMRRWRYPAAAPDRRNPRVACQSFRFRIAR